MVARWPHPHLALACPRARSPGGLTRQTAEALGLGARGGAAPGCSGQGPCLASTSLLGSGRGRSDSLQVLRCVGWV